MPKRFEQASAPQSIAIDSGETKMFDRLRIAKGRAASALLAAGVMMMPVMAWAQPAPDAPAAAAAPPPPPSGLSSIALALNGGDTAWMLT